MSIPKRYRTILTSILLGLLGMPIGYLLGKLIRDDGSSLPTIGPWIWLILVLNIFLVIAWHELGHLIGGWLSGFQFYLYAVGPLRIDRGPRGIEWNFNRNLSLWGGVAATSPAPDKIASPEQLRTQMLSLVAGGPLASLIGVSAFWPATLLWPGQPLPAAAFGIFGFLSAAIFIATMMPIQTGGFMSDGARILNLLKQDSTADPWFAAIILGTLAQARRPREWPAALVNQVTAGTEVNYDAIMAMWMRFSWHLDQGKLNEARHWLDKSLEQVDQWPEAAKPILFASAADFYARYEHDIEKARHYLDKARKPGFVHPSALAITESAVLAAEGRKDEARNTLRRSTPALDMVSGSSRDALAETIAAIEAKIS